MWLRLGPSSKLLVAAGGPDLLLLEAPRKELSNLTSLLELPGPADRRGSSVRDSEMSPSARDI